MRTLQWVTRVGLALAPGLRRLQPLRLVEEIWSNLCRETDFRQEARNVRRFAEAFAGSPTIHIPALIDDLYSESVLVQELSGGNRIDDPEVQPDGPRLAQALVDAYFHQLFVLGVFHGDPHPGNIFITPGGKICLHDFGLVGFLDRATRRRLAGFTLAFIQQHAGWLLDCAIDLGVLSGLEQKTAARPGGDRRCGPSARNGHRRSVSARELPRQRSKRRHPAQSARAHADDVPIEYAVHARP
jgi:ubiquinone biosynthesis protein